jgi:hypothetical protein
MYYLSKTFKVVAQKNHVCNSSRFDEDLGFEYIIRLCII